MIARQFSVSFWAKGIPGTWNPFISKRGEDTIGWQVRRGSGITEAFTIRGSSSSNTDGVGSREINDGVWHHFAAVWDGYTGTRKCYVDGNLDPSVDLINDFAPMMMAPNHHLMLGAREPAQVASVPSPAIEGGFSGSLYDVQMFNYPLSATAVKALAFIPAINVLPAQRSLPAPQTMTVEVILPAGANQSQAVTVQVRNDAPTVASLSGAVANVLTLNYPMGGSITQQVTVAGIKDGTGKLTATGGGFLAGSSSFNVWADPGSKLIGRWISGAANLLETSGFRPAGTHDGVAVGANAASLTFSSDVPVGYAGQSLDLSAGEVAVMITNSSSAELGYVETFDNQMQNKFSIAFWAKGTPASDWNPWVSKRGEGDGGYQVRRHSNSDPIRPTFTIRGTAGSDDPDSGVSVDNDTWHHYAAAWDSIAGSRTLYVDGKSILSLSGDTGPMGLATIDHLVLGGRQNGGFGNFFAGLLYDVPGLQLRAGCAGSRSAGESADGLHDQPFALDCPGEPNDAAGGDLARERDRHRTGNGLFDQQQSRGRYHRWLDRKRVRADLPDRDLGLGGGPPDHRSRADQDHCRSRRTRLGSAYDGEHRHRSEAHRSLVQRHGGSD